MRPEEALLMGGLPMLSLGSTHCVHVVNKSLLQGILFTSGITTDWLLGKHASNSV